MHITLLAKNRSRKTLLVKKKTPCETSWNFKSRSINFLSDLTLGNSTALRARVFLRWVGSVGRVERVERRLVYRSGWKLPPFAKIVMFPINFTYKWTICCCCCCFFSFDNYFKPIKSQKKSYLSPCCTSKTGNLFALPFQRKSGPAFNI